MSGSLISILSKLSEIEKGLEESLKKLEETQHILQNASLHIARILLKYEEINAPKLGLIPTLYPATYNLIMTVSELYTPMKQLITYLKDLVDLTRRLVEFSELCTYQENLYTCDQILTKLSDIDKKIIEACNRISQLIETLKSTYRVGKKLEEVKKQLEEAIKQGKISREEIEKIRHMVESLVRELLEKSQQSS